MGNLVEEGEVGAEGGHDVTIVGDGNALKGGDGSFDLVGGHEAEDTNHGKTAVVDLHIETAGLLRVVHLLVEAKGIIKVKDEVDIVTEGLERGVVTGAATTHVVLLVLSTAALVPKLEEAKDKDDLPLGLLGEGIPLRLGAEVGAGELVSGKGVGPGEDEVGLDNVSDESSHGDTGVLDLGLTEEANSGLVTLSPEIALGEVEGVPELDDGVEVFGEGLKVLAGPEGRKASVGGGRGKGGGRAGDEGSNSELHVLCFLLCRQQFIGERESKRFSVSIDRVGWRS